MLKKTAVAVLSLLTALCLFAGCDNTENGNKKNDDGKIGIVCTIFPQYDWVREIVGDAENVDLTLLLDSGADLHSYQPTAADIVKISKCDLFVYTGGESDAWVDEVIIAAGKEPEHSINEMKLLGNAVFEEEEVSGMQVDEDEHEDDGEIEYDEHVWLSLKNADVICREIAKTLCEIDPENAENYNANCEQYCTKLSALSAEYDAMLLGAARKTILFADRFPFRYLAEDYGLSCYAAFSGCSAETEASFDTVSRLAAVVNENDLPVILITETSDGKIAGTVKNETKDKDQKILVMDAMQSVTKAKLQEGFSYLDTMRSNMNILAEALY